MTALARLPLTDVPFKRQWIRQASGLAACIVRVPDYQIRVVPAGPFHRRGCIDGETACGARITGATSSRDYKLDAQLCTDGCFSPRELELGRACVDDDPDF